VLWPSCGGFAPYGVPNPEKFSSDSVAKSYLVPNWLAASAAAFPYETALISAGERTTYAELEREAAGVARRLAGLGVERGDRVALVLPPAHEHVVLLHGLMKLGAVAVPLDPKLTKPELDAGLDAIGAVLVVTDAAQVAEAREADVELDDVLDLESSHCIIHTSGSGGRVKPVELSYANHFWSAVGSATRIGTQPNDRWLCPLGLHHIAGLAIVLRSALYGTGVVLAPLDPDEIRELVVTEQVTIASLVGTALARLLDAGIELDRLRCALLGGGPVPSGLIDRALDAGVPIAPTYGLTEAASQVTTLPPGQTRARPGSAGTPILPAEVRIDGGSILVRGPNVAGGELGADGWLRTGDLGHIDTDGHLYVQGRGDDVIVTGGENVSPEEVEQVLCSHPAVADAGVTGREDPEWQSAVVAAVVLRDEAKASEGELLEFCRRRLVGFKVPKQIVLVSSLPRNAQGKLVRSELLIRSPLP
jgi:o-succinylbenzoate---CoA ligase